MSDFKDFNQLLVCLYFLLFVEFAVDLFQLFVFPITTLYFTECYRTTCIGLPKYKNSLTLILTVHVYELSANQIEVFRSPSLHKDHHLTSGGQLGGRLGGGGGNVFSYKHFGSLTRDDVCVSRVT